MEEEPEPAWKRIGKTALGVLGGILGTGALIYAGHHLKRKRDSTWSSGETIFDLDAEMMPRRKRGTKGKERAPEPKRQRRYDDPLSRGELFYFTHPHEVENGVGPSYYDSREVMRSINQRYRAKFSEIGQ